ncbi:MAG TPA: hypothetical protein VIG46_11815 [Candidatus Baltobacteraceae bacterium]
MALALAPVVALAAAGGPAKPLRHLAYSFTYTETSDRTQHDSGIGGPASGMADSKSGSSDKGEILVDIMGAAKDASLVVSISEKARDTRSAAPVTCAAFSNTNVICENGKKVNDEELAVLRLLGAKFINTDLIDEKNHWNFGWTSDQLDRSVDFTVNANDNNMLKITEARVEKVKGAQGYTATLDGKITYNLTKVVPVAIDEDTTTRQSIGMGDYDTARTQISLTLESDSLGGN